MTQSNTPAGWYDDGHGNERFWDGNAWTEQTRPLAGTAPEASGTDGGTAAGPDSAATMFAPGGATPGSTPQASAAPAAPSAPAAPVPSADATQVAPSGGFGARPANTPAQQAAPQAQPSAPAWQQPAQPAAQPGVPAWQQPGQPGQPAQSGIPAWQQQPFVGAGSGGGGNKTPLILGLVGGGAALLLIVVVLLVVLGGGGSPKGVAEEYLEAKVKGDLEKVCELSTKAEQEDVFDQYDVDNCGDAVEEIKDDPESGYDDDFTDLAQDLDVEIEVEEPDEKDDSADVDYSQKVEYTGNDDDVVAQLGAECYEVEGTVELKKEDGDWKVADDNTDFNSYKTC